MVKFCIYKLQIWTTVIWWHGVNGVPDKNAGGNVVWLMLLSYQEGRWPRDIFAVCKRYLSSKLMHQVVLYIRVLTRLSALSNTTYWILWLCHQEGFEMTFIPSWKCGGCCDCVWCLRLLQYIPFCTARVIQHTAPASACVVPCIIAIMKQQQAFKVFQTCNPEVLQARTNNLYSTLVSVDITIQTVYTLQRTSQQRSWLMHAVLFAHDWRVWHCFLQVCKITLPHSFHDWCSRLLTLSVSLAIVWNSLQQQTMQCQTFCLKSLTIKQYQVLNGRLTNSYTWSQFSSMFCCCKLCCSCLKISHVQPPAWIFNCNVSLMCWDRRINKTYGRNTPRQMFDELHHR